MCEAGRSKWGRREVGGGGGEVGGGGEEEEEEEEERKRRRREKEERRRRSVTKLANIPPDITMDTKLHHFHFLFDISMTTTTLGSDEIVVRPNYSWTPVDYYVTGHAISHSNCSWRLNFIYTSIDDDNFELFCQGCAPLGELDAGPTSHTPISVTSGAIDSPPKAYSHL